MARSRRARRGRLGVIRVLVEERPGAVLGVDRAVDEADLVLVEQLGEDVARRQRVAPQVEELAGRERPLADAVGAAIDDQVPPVPGEVRVPVTIQPPKRRSNGIACPLRSRRNARSPPPVRLGTTDSITSPGMLSRCRVRVAGHAVLAAAEVRDLPRGEAVGDVEDGPQVGIERDDLDLPARDEPDIGVIVEVKCAAASGRSAASEGWSPR